MATDRFSQVITEARKFRTGLVIAHQNSSQLSADLNSVIRNNVNTICAFQTGAQEAAGLAAEIASGTAKEEVRLNMMAQRPGECYLLRRDVGTVRMRAHYTPDPQVASEAVEALRQVAFEEYSRPAAEIDREIEARLYGVPERVVVSETGARPSSPKPEVRNVRKG